jgi:hypothetical protein
MGNSIVMAVNSGGVRVFSSYYCSLLVDFEVMLVPFAALPLIAFSMPITNLDRSVASILLADAT